MRDPPPQPPRALRVAFLVERYPCRTETFVRDQAAGLTERGIRVEILAREPAEEESDGVTVRCLRIPRDRAARALGAAVRFTRSFLRRPRGFLRLLALRFENRTTPFVDAVYATARLLRAEKGYDVLHAQFGQLGPLAAVLARTGFHRGAVVASFRGYDLTEFLRRNDPRTFGLLFRTADLLLPVCDHFADRLRELGCDPARIAVHRSGIDLARFPFAPPAYDPDGTLRLLTVGRLVPKKGTADAVRVLDRLGDRDASLEVVGDGPLRGKLEALAAGLGVADRVVFAGEIPRDGVRERLARSHLLLALSRTSAAGDEEGIPNAAKEAMATGVPVVATRHAGIPELIEDGVSGLLAPEGDPDVAATRVRYLADHPEVWAPIREAARRRVEERYDGEALNDALAGLYRGLRAGAGAGER